MPLNAIDYTETIIYKIVCNNLSILDVYVGHTTSFKDRKGQHKRKSIKGKEKLYQMIRENGGWENWEMIEIEKYSCKDVNEAKKRERYWYDELKAKLNTNRPIIIDEDMINYWKIKYQKELELHPNLGHDKYQKQIVKDPNYNAKHYQKYKESQLELKKIYTETHKVEKAEYDKKRREEKAVEIKQKKAEYYQKKKAEKLMLSQDV